MDAEGVDVNLLIPGTWAPASSALDPSLTTGLYAAYHDYMREFCGVDTNRLKGLFLAPGGAIEWAVSELKRIGNESWGCGGNMRAEHFAHGWPRDPQRLAARRHADRRSRPRPAVGGDE